MDIRRLNGYKIERVLWNNRKRLVKTAIQSKTTETGKTK
jgi:hypothetical protein